MTEIALKNIFVSVGSRFTMDRLLSTVDDLVSKHPTLSIKAQTGASSFTSPKMQLCKWCDQNEFEVSVSECDVFISHAGMGNILLAAKYRKPIVIVPRRFELSEHINDHQIGTAAAFANRPNIYIANNLQEIEDALIRIADHSNKTAPHSPPHGERERLITAIKTFIGDD